jgi:hypothetical protein
LQSVIFRCLEKDRRERFPSVAALAAALAPFARSQRDAETIVERTAHMQDGLPRGIEPAVHWEASPATTLSQSVGATAARPRPQLARSSAVSLGALALATVMALIVSLQLYPGEPPDLGPRPRTIAQPPPIAEPVPEGGPAAELPAPLPVEPQPGSGAYPSPGASPPSAPGAPACEAIEAVLQEAKLRDAAGNARSALGLVQEVLSCPQGASAIRTMVAGRYACRAHDHGAASQYHKQVREELRHEIEQACLKVGIHLPDP